MPHTNEAAPAAISNLNFYFISIHGGSLRVLWDDALSLVPEFGMTPPTLRTHALAAGYYLQCRSFTSSADTRVQPCSWMWKTLTVPPE